MTHNDDYKGCLPHGQHSQAMLYFICVVTDLLQILISWMQPALVVVLDTDTVVVLASIGNS